jgi:hypothetical protein
MSVKEGDRFRVNDLDRGTVFCKATKDTDEIDPLWPRVQVRFEGEDGTSHVMFYHLTPVPKDTPPNYGSPEHPQAALAASPRCRTA